MSKSVSKSATLPSTSSFPDELPESPAAPGPALAGMSVYDARPFFEKALVYGVQHGLIDAQKLEAINNDAPKGMVQIARYFGNEFLRPDLEKARERLVNLVSLHLEQSTAGDLREAAHLLRDNSFLSRSKAGSDMLKALIAMPANTSFDRSESHNIDGESDDPVKELAKRSLWSLPEYQSELLRCQSIILIKDTAVWFSERLGLPASKLENICNNVLNPMGKHAEEIIRTSLLIIASNRRKMTNWIEFEKMIFSLRKKFAGKNRDQSNPVLPISLFDSLPNEMKDIVLENWGIVLSQLPKILNSKLSPYELFKKHDTIGEKEFIAEFKGKYFWIEADLLDGHYFDDQNNNYESIKDKNWRKITGGRCDEGSLITIFLRVSTGQSLQTLISSGGEKTFFTEKSAKLIIRKIQKSGFKEDLVIQFIDEYVPHKNLESYKKLWEHFVQESKRTLQSDSFDAITDSLALLRRECHVIG